MKQSLIRKSIGLLLSLLLLLSVATAAFAAPDAVLLTGKAGDSVAWTLTSDGVLTVSGTGPIVDETEIESYEDGTSCTSTLDSIGMTFGRYYDEKAEGLGAADAARVRFDLCKEIVVEEGITEIPSGEFSNMYPARVTLPSTLERMGYDALDLSFAESITVSSVKLEEMDVYVPAYDSSAEPYESLAAAREGYLAQTAAQEAFDLSMAPFDVLFTWAYVKLFPDEANWLQMGEAEQQEMLTYYNTQMGTQAADLELLVPDALQQLNALFGTDYQSYAEIFSGESDEYGNSIVTDPALQAMIDERAESLYNNSRLVTKPLTAMEDPRVAYSWFTVTAPAGGKIESDCRECGVTFVALEGVTVPSEADENACKFCGKDHSGSFLQKIVGLFHKVFYFFAHLLGKM